MKRFVLLYHQLAADHVDESHYDLMLEEGDQLRTWRLAEKPDLSAPVQGQAIFPHRLAYLDYEGEITGNRGSVIRVDRGTYQIVSEDDRQLLVELYGAELVGRLAVLIS